MMKGADKAVTGGRLRSSHPLKSAQRKSSLPVPNGNTQASTKNDPVAGAVSYPKTPWRRTAGNGSTRGHGSRANRTTEGFWSCSWGREQARRLLYVAVVRKESAIKRGAANREERPCNATVDALRGFGVTAHRHRLFRFFR